MVMSDYLGTSALTALTASRLAGLAASQARVEALEARADLLAETSDVRAKLEALTRLHDQYGALGPALSGLQFQVAELRRYLQAVYDADTFGDAAVRQLTTHHCVAYALRLLDDTAEASKYSAVQGSLGILELASSALHMFSQRPGGAQAILDNNGVAVLSKLLSPLYPPAVVTNAAHAVGNLAADNEFRIAFRAGGGVGALVRLLRPDVEAAVQTAGAAALSLMAARDIVVQDSARYLGAIEHLTDMLATGDAYASEVARYTLLSLRRGNVKNQASIITALRASPSLAKDVRRLTGAAELLSFEQATPERAADRGAARRLFHDDVYGTPSRSYSPTRSSLRPPSPTSVSPYYLTTSASRPSTARYSSPSKAIYHHTSSYATPLPSDPRRYVQPPPSYRKSYYESLLPFSSTAASSYFSSRPVTASTVASYSQSEEDWQLGPVPEVTVDVLRKKHLSRYSTEELVNLLQEWNFDRLDLRPFRLHGVTGIDLLDMTEEDMVVQLVLPRAKVRVLRGLQRAVQLFDRISTLPRQGKLSEIELRLYLASNGCGVSDVDKLLDLLKTLVRTERFDFVTFYDFLRSYDWIAQAFRIYEVPV